MAKRMNRRTIRKPWYNSGYGVLFLYGRLMKKNKAKGYCWLHKCYLAEIDLKEKRCIKKKCNYLKEVK